MASDGLTIIIHAVLQLPNARVLSGIGTTKGRINSWRSGIHLTNIRMNGFFRRCQGASYELLIDPHVYLIAKLSVLLNDLKRLQMYDRFFSMHDEAHGSRATRGPMAIHRHR